MQLVLHKVFVDHCSRAGLFLPFGAGVRIISYASKWSGSGNWFTLKGQRMGIGERLRRIRGERSVAEFSSSLEVSESSLRRYEHEERSPEAEFIYRLWELEGVNPLWLVTGEGSQRPDDQIGPVGVEIPDWLMADAPTDEEGGLPGTIGLTIEQERVLKMSQDMLDIGGLGGRFGVTELRAAKPLETRELVLVNAFRHADKTGKDYILLGALFVSNAGKKVS